MQQVYIIFSFNTFYKKPDDGSQLQLKHVAVNKLIRLVLCVCVADIIHRGYLSQILQEPASYTLFLTVRSVCILFYKAYFLTVRSVCILFYKAYFLTVRSVCILFYKAYFLTVRSVCIMFYKAYFLTVRSVCILFYKAYFLTSIPQYKR